MATAQERLNQILLTWHDLLTQWSLDGSLVAAATDALQLDSSNAKQDANGQLQTYMSQWSAGNFKNLPQIVLLSADDISGARGAYADSTDTIYLNADWLLTASDEEIQKILTHELGHYLDDQLNKQDSQGDEGALFSARLHALELSKEQVSSIRAGDDRIFIVVDGNLTEAQSAGATAWPALVVSGDSNQVGNTVNALSDGSVLATGYFFQNATLGQTTLDGGSGGDVYVARINSEGIFQRITRTNGSGTSFSRDAELYRDNSLFIAGQFVGEKSFGSTILNSANGSGWIAKVNSNGDFEWARQIPTSGGWSDIGSVAASSDVIDNQFMYIVTQFQGEVVLGNDIFTAPEGHCISKVDRQGFFVWSNMVDPGVKGMEINSTPQDGELVVSGWFSGPSIILGDTPLSGQYYYNGWQQSLVYTDTAFVAKVSHTGGFIWAKPIYTGSPSLYAGSSGYCKSTSALADGTIVCAIYGESTLQVDDTILTNSSTQLGSWIVRFDGNGNLLWGEFIERVEVRDVISHGDTFFIQGSFAESARLGDVQIFNTSGQNDFFVAKMTPDGEHLWVAQADSYDGLVAIDLDILPDQSVVVTGVFEGSNKLGEQNMLSVEGQDAFIAKINPDGTWVSPSAGLGPIGGDGFFQEGVTLSAGDLGGIDAGEITSYQWYLNSVPIEGATGYTYTVGSTGSGQYKVKVFFLNALGAIRSVISDEQFVSITNQGQAAFTISGVTSPSVLSVGNVLVATNTNSDPDGNPIGGLPYSWQYSFDGYAWKSIVGAGSTYQITSDDELKQIRFTSEYTDAQGYLETVYVPVGTVGLVAMPTITLALSPASVSEDGATNLIYTFTRTGDTTNALSVNYTVGGTATLGSDYTGISVSGTNSVSFAAGSATATVTVNPTADTTIETNETVALTLEAGTGYTIGTTTPVTGTITNDDFPVITLALSPASVSEDGATNLIYTFTRTGDTTNALSVNYTVGGTATLGSDYTGISVSGTNSVSFAAGSATATVTVNPTADTTIETNETVALTLEAGTGYTIGTTTPVTGTITNDDFPVITLALSPASVSEDGATNLIYTFTRTGDTTNALSVNYTVGGTATLGTDYTGISVSGTNSVSFAAGSATATVTVNPTADTTIETNETVALTLEAGTGYTIGTTTPVTGTITNDDFPVITLALSPASVSEDGATNLIYTFTRTGDTTNALSVNYTVGGTATLGTDYTGISVSGTNSVSFAAGSATATVTVNPTADTTIETNETVALTLEAGTGYTIGTTTPVTGTITNDDFPVITLALSPASVSEDGATNLIYTFTRTGDTTNALSVNYTVGGTATLGTDYTGISVSGTNSVSFAAGSATATVTVNPTADTTIETNETVALTLEAGTGYTIGTTTPVTGTITNDDFPVITLALSPASVSEDGATNLIYTFTRTGDTTNALSVNYTVGGTATLGTDYTGISVSGTNSVSFAAGSATATVTVNPTADTTIETNETVALTLATGTGYTIGTTTPVTGTITNDDISSSTSRTLTGTESSLLLTSTKAINGTGNNLDNSITGNSNNNILNGRLGNDSLTGGLGSDTFRFDSVLNGTTNVDRITDFSIFQGDRIQLENTGTGLFTAITATGTLAATAFVNGAFSNTTQRICYESTTGNLFYDADGSASGSASILFATLSTGLAMTNIQFVVT